MASHIIYAPITICFKHPEQQLEWSFELWFAGNILNIWALLPNLEMRLKICVKLLFQFTANIIWNLAVAATPPWQLRLKNLLQTKMFEKSSKISNI